MMEAAKDVFKLAVGVCAVGLLLTLFWAVGHIPIEGFRHDPTLLHYIGKGFLLTFFGTVAGGFLLGITYGIGYGITDYVERKVRMRRMVKNYKKGII